MGTSLSLPLVGAVGCSAYVVTSLYLLHNPLTRSRPSIARIKFIAHRGGAGEGYENTCLTYARAVASGVEMLELDVHLTRDHEVVVSHDQNLARVTGVNSIIRDLDYSQLPTIKPRLNIDFDPGQHYCDETVIEEERTLPTLDMVLKQFPSTQINIDVKVKDEGLVEAVNRVIVENDAEARCVWGSFSEETCDKCLRTNPRIGLIFSMLTVVKLYLLFYLGLLPFVQLDATHLELPMPSIFLEDRFRSEEGNVGMARKPKWIIRMLDWILMSPTLFQHLDKRGVTVYLWVLNQPSQFERAFSLGVHGVMTDYPTRLKQFLDKKDH